MNAVRCPQCSLVNATSAVECGQCGFPLTHLPSSAYVFSSGPEYEKTAGFSAPPPTINQNYEILAGDPIGEKTHFWYKVYCVVLALLSLAVGFMGIFLIANSASIRSPRGMEEPAVLGAIYAVLGFALFIPFIIAPFFPRKPWSWIYGLILICLGLSSCCLLPFLIPLIIYWFKPETQAYFGRNKP